MKYLTRLAALAMTLSLAASLTTSCAQVQDESGTELCAAEPLEPVMNFPWLIGTVNYGCTNVRSVRVEIWLQKQVPGGRWINFGPKNSTFNTQVPNGELRQFPKEELCENGKFRTKIKLEAIGNSGTQLVANVFDDDVSYSREVRIDCRP